MALAAVAFLMWGAPARASVVDPLFVPDNPSCGTLGLGSVSVRIDPPRAGATTTYSLDNAAAGTGPQLQPPNAVTPPPPGAVNTVAVNIDAGNQFFDWVATLGVDAVLAKGGPNLDAYVYDPPTERLSDTQLHAPINPANGQPFQLSHIDVCFDYELSVSKTAVTSLKKTFAWTIDKSVSPATWDLFRGDTGTSDYKVALTKDAGTDSDWAVDGQINIKNQTPFSVPITNVTDRVSDPINPIAATVTCPGGLSQTLPPNGTLNCTYHADLPNAATRTNTARAVSARGSATPPAVGDGVGTAAVDFAAANITKVNDSVTVDDSVEGSLGTFSASRAATYSRKFTCDADDGPHPNTATISPASASASPSDSASVAVHCFALAVDKTATTSFTRTHAWTIDKTATPTEKTIATGATFSADYSVTVDAKKSDSGHKVSGRITVTNPAGAPTATINSVSDVVSTALTASVDCGVTFPHQLAPGGTLTCDYSRDLPDGVDRTNTATATLQNHIYDSAGTPTNSGTTDFTGKAAVIFGAPTTEVDKSITVSDAVAPGGTLGTATFGTDTLPKTFPTYSQTIGPYTTCGDQTVKNTAAFVGSSGGTGSDIATVTAHVQCKLTVTKKLDPATDAGTFNLLIDRTTAPAGNVVTTGPVGDGGTTGAQQVALGTYKVSETAAPGTTLSDYVTAIGGDCSPTGAVTFAAGDSDKSCTITNTRKGSVAVVKTVKGAAPSGTQEFTFQLRRGATTTSSGTIDETLKANAANGGLIAFTTKLIPGDTYQLCEVVMPAWLTSLGTFVPDSFMPPDGIAPNVNVDNSILCVNFTVNAGENKTVPVDNTPPPGGRALTIGFWKNWSSCSGGNQKPVLDQTLAKAEPDGLTIGMLTLHGSTATPNAAPDCAKAVRVLNKSTVDATAKKMASDPAFNLASQMLAALLNKTAGAGISGCVLGKIAAAQSLLATVKFDGLTHLKMSPQQVAEANNLAKALDDYNNDRPVLCP